MELVPRASKEDWRDIGMTGVKAWRKKAIEDVSLCSA